MADVLWWLTHDPSLSSPPPPGHPHTPTISTSQYHVNMSEAHSDVALYSGWDYTDYTSLAHVPLRPPNDYYTLSDILANGTTLEGSHINILAAVRDVSRWPFVGMYLL